MIEQVENVVETAVKSRLPAFAKYGAWFLVLALSVTALLLSGIALQRSKLDNNTIKNISQITERLERTASRLDAITNNSNMFNRNQSDYLHSTDRDAQGNYDAFSKKFGGVDLSIDDGTNSWLFSQDNSFGSQQSNGNQKSGDSDKWLREQGGRSKG